ncbi:MAG TPA: NAD(P)H-quinone oxidoreductase [Porticoccaceae bacterium]|jgi:NADPH2:quinone reductase|nr:NAD(P)H-quinone oxidoreductase [Porticoccaceae bacterium]
MSLLPEKHLSIEILTTAEANILSPCQRQLESPSSHQVIIEVAAAGVNRPDVFQRMGFYPPPPGASDIPGLEVSGTIVAIGTDVRKYKIGDQVCALLSGGGYAEYALAEEDLCLPIPDNLSLVEAAALPETCFTVWHNLFERAALQANEYLLVHGGSSGIGTTAIQMASALGVKVIATAGSDEKCKVCERLGAIRAINYNKQDFVVESQKLTNRGVNVVLDMVGGDYIEKNIAACAQGARIVSIAFLRGSRIDVDFLPVMLKQLILTGSTLRAQPLADKARIAQGVKQTVWPLIAENKFKPVIHKTFNLSNAQDSHRLMETNEHIGKLLLLNH